MKRNWIFSFLIIRLNSVCIFHHKNFKVLDIWDRFFSNVTRTNVGGRRGKGGRRKWGEGGRRRGERKKKGKGRKKEEGRMRARGKRRGGNKEENQDFLLPKIVIPWRRNFIREGSLACFWGLGDISIWTLNRKITVYAGLVTDEAAKFLRTPKMGFRELYTEDKVIATKITKVLGLFLTREEPIKHWKFQKRNLKQKLCPRKHPESGGGKQFTLFFFPLLYFLLLLILGITSCPKFFQLLLMLWIFSSCLAGIHQSTIFPLLNLFLNIGHLSQNYSLMDKI